MGGERKGLSCVSAYDGKPFKYQRRRRRHLIITFLNNCQVCGYNCILRSVAQFSMFNAESFTSPRLCMKTDEHCRPLFFKNLIDGSVYVRFAPFMDKDVECHRCCCLSMLT